MVFPRTQPLQAASIYTQQANVQQTGGIDISNILSLIMPLLMVSMMIKTATNMGKPKQAKTFETKNTVTQSKRHPQPDR